LVLHLSVKITNYFRIRLYLSIIEEEYNFTLLQNKDILTPENKIVFFKDRTQILPAINSAFTLRFNSISSGLSKKLLFSTFFTCLQSFLRCRFGSSFACNLSCVVVSVHLYYCGVSPVLVEMIISNQLKRTAGKLNRLVVA